MASSSGKANLLGKRKLEDGLETKPILRKHKEKETTKEFSEQNKGSVELSDTKSDDPNLITVKETGEGLDESPDIVEVPKKTLFVGAFSNETEISDIIDFFKDVGQVVRVRLIVTRECVHRCCGFVEFASSKEAKKALENKNGEYFQDRKIYLDVADKGATYLPPKYCIDHKVWYEEDYLQGESLPIEEYEGLDETPDFTEEVLLVANLSSQTTKITHILDFFTDIAEVISVRLIVNHQGKHVGYAFVEFISAYHANRALEERNGEYLHDHKILLMKAFDKTPDYVKAVATVRNRTVFVTNLSRGTEISEIINFFKDVGEVIHVRLIVDRWGHLLGRGYVEFASAKEAKKARHKKKGEYLRDSEIFLDLADNGATYFLRPKYCIDHIVWFEDYLQQESLAGLDETPDFAEEVAVREKTVFVDKIKKSLSITKIIRIFKVIGEVVRVRVIVDQWGEQVGCCFLEFASANEANKAVIKRNGSTFYVIIPEIAAPYPFRPKYDLAEKLWYEDNLRQESLDLESMKIKKVISRGKMITFSSDED